MICKQCGKTYQNVTHVCPFCGTQAGAEGFSGEVKAVVYGDRKKNAEAPKSRHLKTRGQQKREERRKKSLYRRRAVNWAWVRLTVLILAAVSVAAGYTFLKLTPDGQLILARMGKEANADAYWALGLEYLDRGYVQKSIETYEKALEQEPERDDLVEKLMLMGEAYEAGGELKKAEEVYLRIARKLKPEDPLGYNNVIRLMQSQGRTAETVAVMKEAYEHTRDLSFNKERTQILPKPPVASLTAGTHLLSKTVRFYSEQGYDVYYCTGDEQLPEEGIKFTDELTLNEGVHTFRAVAVSQELISDEMQVKYIITLPTPLSPRANVQPGEYSKPFRIKLRIPEEEKARDKKVKQTLRIFYTIDGTKPTTLSPEFTGESILLPPGRVVLKAIAVNQYGKSSNVSSADYKIKGKIINKFSRDDKTAGLSIPGTTMDQFKNRFGAAEKETKAEDGTVKGAATIWYYPWGEARFFEGGLYHLETTDSGMKAPRNTAVGMTMDEITPRFRDMGQVPNAKGDRGIYYSEKEGYAEYRVESDDPKEGILEYCVLLPTGERRGTLFLQYHIQGGKTVRVVHRYTDEIVTIIR